MSFQALTMSPQGLLKPEDASEEDRLMTVISSNYTPASREGDGCKQVNTY